MLSSIRPQFAEIIDFLPDATFVIDSQGRVVIWNQAMEDLTGIKSESILGKSNGEYSLAVYGKKREMLVDLLLDCQKKSWKEITCIFPNVIMA